MTRIIAMQVAVAGRPRPAATRLGRTSSLAFLSWLTIAAAAAFAQSGTTATVSGTVTDGSGAVLPSVQVTITNVATGASRTTETTGSGLYSVAQLQPGQYTLSVTQNGFKSFQQQNIVLVIGQIAEIDPRLEVGAQQEQVTVTAGPPVIQSEDSSVGLVIDAATITDTPLNGRLGITGLLALAPGVQGAGSQDQIPSLA